MSVERQTTETLSPEEQLYRIGSQTNDDGTVDVEILGWEKNGEAVDVEFVTPTGNVESERMLWPEADDAESYKFIRIVDKAGYGIVAADAIAGEFVPASRKSSGSWTLDAEPEPTYRERFVAACKRRPTWSLSTGDWLFWKTFGVSWILIPFSMLHLPFDSENAMDEAVGYSMACWHITIWALLSLAFLYGVGVI